MNRSLCILCCFALSVWTTLASVIPLIRYGVLIDAGSSGSRAKVYRVVTPLSQVGSGVPSVQLISNFKVEPGISEFEDNIPGLTPYLRELIDSAKAVVPANRQAETPIYLMATAGLRLLLLQDQEILLDAIRAQFANSMVNPFKYESPDQVQIISGEEEGVYAWIATNYLLGFFDSERPVEESVGVVEMGGASTQIAFIPSDPLLSEEFHVTIADRQYSLYVQSYLQYGGDALVIKMADQLIQESMLPDTVTEMELFDPCRLIGDEFVVTLQGNVERNVTLKGTSDPRKCQEVLDVLLETATGYDCSPEPCAIGSRYQPLVYNMPFYGLGVFLYTPSDLGVIDDTNSFLDIGLLEFIAQEYCLKTFQQAVDEGGDPKYISSRCLTGLYIPKILEKYGFDRAMTQQINAVSQVSGTDIDWTLGAYLQTLYKPISGQA